MRLLLCCLLILGLMACNGDDPETDAAPEADATVEVDAADDAAEPETDAGLKDAADAQPEVDAALDAAAEAAPEDAAAGE